MRIVMAIIAIVYFVATLILFILTMSIVDYVPRFWRKPRHCDFPEDPAISNCNSGINNW